MSEINMNITDDLFESLPEEEKNSEFIAVAIKTFAKDAWDRFRRNKLALYGLIYLVVIIILAIVVPMVSPYRFDAQDLANRNALPSLA
ncbi:MAG: ABC transporter permease, partial [Erysipelotrichaceae bacterium]|nr:ABC transporter permease [Erysipelotrichaceae bacterium]